MKKYIALTVLFIAGVATAEEDLGGYLTVWPNNPGSFIFVNAQKRIQTNILGECVSKLAEEFSIDIKMVEDGFPGIDKISSELKEKNAKGAIWIVDNDSMPVILSAVEDGWGVLNVAKMIEDNPDVKKINKRLVKYINRSFAYLNGISDSPMMPACVMKQAVGLAGVDSLLCATYSPEACSKISSYLSIAGYKRCRKGTYYDACEEGWAPAPTNAVQKKIWDKVHKLPTKPLVILPESQRKKSN
jgi:hypothetical protein